MKNNKILIKTNCLEDAISLSQQIPEFESVYQKNEYNNRLNGVNSLVLTAYIHDKPIGFKIGYEAPTKQNFYSWMGGVLPKFRKFGIAEKLMTYQEQWATKARYQSILVKTRNKHIAMIKLLQKHNYIKLGIIPYDTDEETRILYEKKLNLS